MPREGLLLQTDGSRHDWLEDRGPWLTLVGLIDDATGRLTGATFRDQEDTAGYLAVLADTLRRHGVPGAIYRDRHTIFEPPEREPLTLEEQLLDTRVPTQLGRAFAELGISSVRARSPQAKGRIERLWGTLQDRLVAELRIARVADLDGANAYLARYLPRFNRRFTVPAADPVPAWRPLPAGAQRGARLLLQVPAHRGTRRDRPSRGHASSSCPRGGTGAAVRDSGWSCTCGSTAAWSSGTASASWSRRRPRSTRSSCGRSTTPASSSARCPGAPPRRRDRPPTTPGVAATPERRLRATNTVDMGRTDSLSS